MSQIHFVGSYINNESKGYLLYIKKEENDISDIIIDEFTKNINLASEKFLRKWNDILSLKCDNFEYIYDRCYKINISSLYESPEFSYSIHSRQFLSDIKVRYKNNSIEIPDGLLIILPSQYSVLYIHYDHKATNPFCQVLLSIETLSNYPVITPLITYLQDYIEYQAWWLYKKVLN